MGSHPLGSSYLLEHLSGRTVVTREDKGTWTREAKGAVHGHVMDQERKLSHRSCDTESARSRPILVHASLQLTVSLAHPLNVDD